MADQEDEAKRLARLTKWFNSMIHGNREMKSAADGKRFLEALCAQEDASKCVECIVAAPVGLNVVAKAFRFNRDSAFLDGPASSVLHYLRHPSLKQLYAGQFLTRVLEHIVQPPTFWNTFTEAYHARILSQDAVHAFAWLLLEILCCRSDDVPDVRLVAERVTHEESLINGSSLEIRSLGQKIKHVLNSTSSDAVDGPGGRHDNDFVDFRKIKILPTADEFASNETPYYRRADAVESVEIGSRGLLQLDNQFRLLREDMLGELRSDFQIATGQKKGRRKLVLSNLRLTGIDCGTSARRKLCSLTFICPDDLPQMDKIKVKGARKKYLDEHKSVMKHQSLGCLISNGTIVAFASVDRNEDLLAESPPTIVLRVTDEASFNKALFASKSAVQFQFVQVDTAVFSYEPILRCLQSMTDLPLEEQLLDLGPGSSEVLSGIQPTDIVNCIRNNWESDLQSILGTTKGVVLDAAQARSLLTGLTKRVSLIQGPPGTGKSFIGALIAKVLHDHTSENFLVMTYTNHALDQFLGDLQNIGIPADSIVRLGSKASPSTRALSISEQKGTYKMDGETYHLIQDQQKQADAYREALSKKVSKFHNMRVTEDALLAYLEFSDDSEYFDAFEVPTSEDGMVSVGRKGKSINKFYLIKRWATGDDAGVFKTLARQQYPGIWSEDAKARSTRLSCWQKEIWQEQISEIGTLMSKYNQCREKIDQLFRGKQRHIIKNKRIIACTTTGAAMYTEELRSASPGIVLVEEAGEILESHILTALTPKTKQLVLIGDHKQLRPKVANYSLTVEQGGGYNLNVSLFERLVHAGVSHTTLSKQHRMRPEISSLVRSLTYPELEDAYSTKGRPPLRGFQDDVIFVSHHHPELNADNIAERRDESSKSSKENMYEADMVLKCVRYLAQQGYNTENLVILTPYLGQLYLLLRTLSSENDPILNDLDSYELVRAGLLTPAAANVSKRNVRISTIDNYQGEESDIVIACLTRSNPVGDIGFMSAPQRVNVLLSRARNGLILIGNADTFMESRKGKDVWVPLMDNLKKDGHIYDGFPVKCEQHPDKVALISQKEDFDSVCPDGGCSEPCGKMLSCGVHVCPHRCHQLQDHSKMECTAIVTSKCSRNHKTSRKCHDKAAVRCRKCEHEDRVKEQRAQRDHRLEQERQARQQAYATRMAQMEEEIEHERRVLKDQGDERDRQHALAQKKEDLARLREKARKPHVDPLNHDKGSSSMSAPIPIPARQDPKIVSSEQDDQGAHSAATPSESADQQSVQEPPANNENLSDWDKSESKDDWEWQKQFDGAENEALDLLMEMIGLESVKEQFLAIKAKVDTVVRQNVSLKGERFGAALLGNPGTGKTTAARLYAKFLVQVGALPGDHFLETTGAALANDGVSACKAHIDTILEKGGGVFFIDEAYQLVSGNSFGGKAVLDFLLAEIENLTGKIVFVLAGYHKNMEAFYAHNPGIPSRIPITMEFQDYNDQELQRILCHYVDKKYKGDMKMEDGMQGLFARIVCRRIGRGRGRDGFGNAREVQNRISHITERQARRLRKERKEGLKPDDYFLSKEDMIGPEPSSVLKNNAAWNRLQKLIGLQSVKQSVQILLDGIQYNYQRELQEKPLVQYSLNKCFIGSPGTGKTSVAKLYGRILADIGMLSNGEVVVKNPADFVGNVLGQSESNTKAILTSTLGKVLIIDEAYMLAGSATSDPYKVAVIDTIVAEVQSTPGEDRCVLLLGYKDQMEEMFRDVNPGLARRFPLESAFVFEDFTDAELQHILDLKLKDVGYNATGQAKTVAMDVLKRARNRPNFGNAGEVDIILDRAKALHQKHLTAGRTKHMDTFEAIDFDPYFDRGERAATNLPKLFEGVVGNDSLIKQFQGYQNTAANMKSLGMDPREQLPFSFLFKGPPGTGKTSTAQKMGKVFYDMGLLAQAKVIECSATDLIGQYVGQTGPKVQKLMEKALGQVLFIDEAYRLAEGGFATEAMDELVDCLTKPKYAQKLVTILAGYEEDMNRLMSINPGLTSRFPESVTFVHMQPATCIELLTKVLAGLKNKKKSPLDLSILEPPSKDLGGQMLDLFGKLSQQKSWANGRDVITLAKSMFGKLLSNSEKLITSLVLTESIVIDTMKSMLAERTKRTEDAGKSRFPGPQLSTPMPMPQLQQLPTLRKSTTSSAMVEAPPQPVVDKEHEQPAPPKQKLEEPPVKSKNLGETDDPLNDIFKAKRDPGVSDAVWEQLERDKHAMVARENEFRRMRDEKRQEEQRIVDLKRAEQQAKDDEEKRRLEAERIQAELERRRNEAILAELDRLREQEKERQKRLRELGPCPMGYQWIKQTGGYRCAGGSHWLADGKLGL
ncbi:P-loop containing nucleoside triphosphate hydrolase protein [Lophiostoma macrostomum CBS 122681]|uniref:P-loop containing nucleoside triphosphate hydrolase protein n=1 Tax=Lophiostoma macrostomum CBS 122681 TaxID=1314788 RepID=A0A6A6SPA8_9PLEO|nr:P-loop containing nucleoside triphosphate hydrolase protein [Lophiostoma macrostomum CBS 122681]